MPDSLALTSRAVADGDDACANAPDGKYIRREPAAMKLLVFGASGQCGRWLVRLGATRGHAITAFVRPGTIYTAPDGVHVVRGDVLDADSVMAVATGHDAILSCLGPQRMSPANPFSALRSPPAFCQRSAAHIVAAATAAGIRQVSAISAAGVADSAPQLPAAMRWLLAHSTIGEMYRDLGEMEKLFASSTLDWFAVRPVTLVNAAPSRRAREVTRFGSLSVIGRADVAQWMLERLAPCAAERAVRTPMIGWW